MSQDGYIFISYHSVDLRLSLRLALDLRNSGFDVWIHCLDNHQRFKSGQAEALEQAIDSCIASVAVLSTPYVNDQVCCQELNRLHKRLGFVYTVLRDKVARKNWPIEIQDNLTIDFSEGEINETNYIQKLNELVRLLKKESDKPIELLLSTEVRYLTNLIADLEGNTELLHFLGTADDRRAKNLNSQIAKKWITFNVFAPPRNRSANVQRKSDLYDKKNLTSKRISDILEEHSRFVLLGKTGAGKTTILQNLALDAAWKRLQNSSDSPLPLLLNLSMWSAGDSIEKFIREYWFIEEDPIELYTKGDLWLYLDGLDETGSLRIDELHLLNNWLQTTPENSHFIITCDIEKYVFEEPVGNLPLVLVEQLMECQIHDIAEHYLLGNSEQFLSQILSPRQSTFEYCAYLTERRSNLYLLITLSVIYRQTMEIESISSLGIHLKRLVAILMEPTRIFTQNSINIEDIESALSDLAVFIIDEDIPYTISHKSVLNHLAGKWWQKLRTKRFADLLQVAYEAHLIHIRGEEICFTHPLIQDYFAALALSRTTIVDKLSPPTFNDGWRVPTKWDRSVLILLGLINNSDEMFMAILAVDPFLAARCYLSRTANSDNILAEIVDALLRVLDQNSTCINTVASLLAQIKPTALIKKLNGSDRISRMIIARSLESVKWLPDDHSKAAYYFAAQNWDECVKLGISALPQLIMGLHDNDKDIRKNSAVALGQIGDKSAFTELSVLLDDEDADVRKSTLNAIAQLGDSLSVSVLVQRLSDWNKDVARAAAKALENVGEPAVPSLIEATHDWDREVREIAAQTLGTIRSHKSIARLTEILLDEQNTVRKAAVKALAIIADLESIPNIISQSLRDEYMDVRRTAAEMLTKIANAKVIPELLVALHDEDTEVRKFTVQALGRIGDDTVEALVSIIQSNDVDVRKTAAEALAKIGTPLVITEMRKLLENESEDMRRTSLSVLDKVQDQSALLPLYLVALKDRANDLRKAATKALGKIGNTAAIPELLKALKDDDWSVRAGAATALGLIKDKTAIAELSIVLQDNSPEARQAAAESLGEIGDDMAIDTLVKALTDISADVRRAVVEALGKIGNKQIVPYLFSALHDSDESVRRDTISILSLLKDSSSVIELTKALHDPVEMVRSAAADALGELGDDRAVAHLIEALRDKSRNLLYETARALQTLKSEKAIPGLLAATEDEDEDIRRTAIETLGEIGLPSAAPDLLKLLAVPSNKNQSDIVAALGKIKSIDSIPALTRILTEERLNDKDDSLCIAALDALGEIGDPQVVPVLINIFERDDQFMDYSVAQTLGKLKAVAAIPSMLEALNSEDDNLRKIAARTLGEIGDASAVPSLLQALQDNCRSDNWICAEALGDIKDRAAVPVLKKMLRDTSSDTRGAAARALGKIGDPSIVQGLADLISDEEYCNFSIGYMARGRHYSYYTVHRGFDPFWWGTTVGSIAIEALEQIATPEALAIVEEWHRKNSESR